jgi:hypothetical protein
MVGAQERAILRDVTNMAKVDSVVSAKKLDASVTKSRKSRLAIVQLGEKFQEVLDEQAASDEVLAHMATRERRALSVPGFAPPKSVEKCLPLSAPERTTAVWMLGNLLEYIQVPETRWLDAFLLLDIYCLKKPNALDCSSLGALCAAVARLVRKLDDAEPTDLVSKLHLKAGGLAQWMQKSCCPHLETQVTQERVQEQETAVLVTLGWNITMPTAQDWMTVFLARLNVFTCQGLMHLLTPLWQHNFQLARLLATHCPTTAVCGTQRVAQGLLCLSLVSAGVLPQDMFGLLELAAPVWNGVEQQQCKPESLEFLLDGLQAATGSDLSTLRADTHLVNETLLALRLSMH